MKSLIPIISVNFLISIIISLVMVIPVSQLKSYMIVQHYLLAKQQNVSVDTKLINNLIVMKQLNVERGLIGDLLINDIVSYINIETNTTKSTNN